jgi:predicted N-formylglutamate amidohydrolase
MIFRVARGADRLFELPMPPLAIDALVVSCEHAGNRVPERYRVAFQTARATAALESHRGYDLGALFVAEALAKRFAAELIYSDVSRLVVELNKSIGHPKLMSEFTQHLDQTAREALLRDHYLPHRERVEAAVRRHVTGGRMTLHLGIHSFAPTLGGRVRQADIGLLYDPQRAQEKELCTRWRRSICGLAPELRVRRNYPYRGDADGLTTTLRRVFPPEAYLGIEVELNQALTASAGEAREALTEVLGEALAAQRRCSV